MAKFFNRHPLVIDVDIAMLIGLHEAIVLQQVIYWVRLNEMNNVNFYEGRYWTFQSIDKWKKENFPFWSTKTISNLLKTLEKEGYLIVGNFNKKGYDRTKWYSVNEEKINALIVGNTHMEESSKWSWKKVPNGVGKKFQMDMEKSSKPIQEINKENNKEINTTQEVCVLSPLEKEIKSLLKDKFKESYTEEYATRVLDLVKDKNETLEGFKEKLEMALDRNIQNKNGYLLKAIQDNYKKSKRNTDNKKTGFSNFNETYTQYSETELNDIIARKQAQM